MTAIAVPTLSEDRGLTQYLHEIRRFPILTSDEEYMLAKRWREHDDPEAARTLVTSHLRLVAKMAMRYRGYRVAVSDLISEGNVGLMKAVRNFDPEKGFRLATYAMWWIKATITEFILKSWSIVRIGALNTQKRLFFSLQRTKARLQIMDEGELSDDDAARLAERYGLPAGDIRQINRRMAGRDVSLDRPIDLGEDPGGGANGHGGDTFVDQMAGDTPDPELLFAEAEEDEIRRGIVRDAIATLSDRDQEIVAARWFADEPQTLEELGNRYGISRERVRQLEQRALKRIKEYLVERGGNVPAIL